MPRKNRIPKRKRKPRRYRGLTMSDEQLLMSAKLEAAREMNRRKLQGTI